MESSDELIAEVLMESNAVIRKIGVVFRCRCCNAGVEILDSSFCEFFFEGIIEESSESGSSPFLLYIDGCLYRIAIGFFCTFSSSTYKSSRYSI